MEVTVQQKVSWPHEHVLGGQTRQCLTYDQINMSQFIKGSQKIFWMKKIGRLENTLQYLGHLMEDASDFFWVSAKASHAVCCVKWKGESSLGWIRPGLTAFAGLTPKSTRINKIGELKWGRNVHGFARIFKWVLVHIVGIMKQGESCTSTFVPFV